MIFNSLVPMPIYTPSFFNGVLVLVLMVALRSISRGYVVDHSIKNEFGSFSLLLLLVFYMGLRPISYYFGDMGTYNRIFESFAEGGAVKGNEDLVWYHFMRFCSGIMSATHFFFLCAVLYTVPLYIACKNWFGSAMYIPFLMIIASFSFWSYGTNGIRNGIATSIFVWAISSNNKVLKITLMAIAYVTHASIIIPISAYVATLFYNKPKYFLFGWLLAVPLSLALGGFWESFFANLGFGDNRLSYLTDGNVNDDDFTSTGFRWDFVIYSASAVFTGYYFIIKKKFKDKVYYRLFNVYVFANAFWILVIRANFSNRFAYLSWFLMAIVIFYPFYKGEFFKKQTKVFSIVILLYFSFTYFMNYVLVS